MIPVPDAPTDRLPDAQRHRAGAGRRDLALRRGCRDSPEPTRTCRRTAADAGLVGPGLHRDVQDSAEPARPHRRPTADAGRVDPPLIPSRHEVTLVELTPVVDEIPPWWDERRLSGRKAA
ncbi:hypothetical protein ACSNOJ_00100 [Streptomyces sp. URMC 128]|uniref:hypothetical protein n=1 Tax=Streptomyces sp. URMC 128 TaxID=3423404 RepID=UPI003F1D417D